MSRPSIDGGSWVPHGGPCSLFSLLGFNIVFELTFFTLLLIL